MTATFVLMTVDLIAYVRCSHIPEYTSMKFQNNAGSPQLQLVIQLSTIQYMCTDMHTIKTAEYYHLPYLPTSMTMCIHYITGCRFGHLDVVRYLVTETHCDPNVRTNNGWTPLHRASW